VKFPPYSKYKPSAVEWLGDIPDQWSVNSVWHVYALGRGRVISHEDIAEDPGEYPVYSSQTEDNGVLGFLRTYDFDGDYITWTTDGANAGTVFRRKGRFNCTNVCGTLKAKRLGKIENGFVAHALNLATREFIRYDINPKLMNNVMAKIRFGVPPFAEQRRIADFLDAETAKLDTLVAKRQELIEKLKEKRSALVSRTVTRGLPPEAARAAGLDPNPKLKPSGVEWLGEIPEHWDVKQLKWAIMFQRGHDLPADDREEGSVPLVTSSGVAATHSVAAAKGPGIVTGRYGTIGQFYLVNEDYWPLNTTLYSIDLRGNEPRFLQYMLTHLAPLFLLNAVKSAVPGVDRNDIHPTKSGIPPRLEQAAIANYLDVETNKIDRMVAKIEQAIERLQEYRTALITAAVTGKIDVRNVRHSAENPNPGGTEAA